MSRYFNRKKEHVFIKDIGLPLVFFLLLVLFLWFGVQGISQKSQDEQLRSARQAVTRRYPPDLAYLTENYGLAVDTEKYVVYYQRIGANLLPQIAVMPAEKTTK